MARLLIGAVFGVVVGVVGGAALGIHAADPDPEAASSQQIAHAAELAGVDRTELEGAMDSTGITNPLVYLRSVGELENPPPSIQVRAVEASLPPSSRVAECIIRAESGGNPLAVNPRSKASGLGQFLPSTWLTTPAGRAGASVFDPVANRSMVNWMLSVGRAGEFSTYRGCR